MSFHSILHSDPKKDLKCHSPNVHQNQCMVLVPKTGPLFDVWIMDLYGGIVHKYKSWMDSNTRFGPFYVRPMQNIDGQMPMDGWMLEMDGYVPEMFLATDG